MHVHTVHLLYIYKDSIYCEFIYCSVQSYVYYFLSFFTEQKWKRITTWFQYLVWPNFPTLSRWPRWEWIMRGGGEGVNTIVFWPSNSSHFSLSDMTDRLTPPRVCSVLPGQMTIVLHHFCKIKFEWGESICFLFSLLSARLWRGERGPIFPSALPKGKQPYVFIRPTCTIVISFIHRCMIPDHLSWLIKVWHWEIH